MKILEVSTSGAVGLSHMGAIVLPTFKLGEALAALGHDVAFVDCQAEEARPQLKPPLELIEVAEPGLNTYLSIRNKENSRQFQQLVRKTSRAVADHIIEHRLDRQFDIIHAHKAQIAMHLFAAGVPCVYTCHTPNYWCNPDEYRSMRGRARRWKVRFDVRRGTHAISAIRKVEMTIGLGDHLAEGVRYIDPEVDTAERVTSVLQGMDIEDWPHMPKAEARAALGVAEDGFRLVYVGRIDQTKGLHVLADAVDTLRAQIPGLHLTIIGYDADTEYADALRDRCRSLPIEFTGFISNTDDEFHHRVAAADLCLVPSLADNQPSVVMQSLALGVPVIGTRVGSIPEMVSEDVGLLVRPNDVQALQQSIFALYEFPERLAEMRANTREYVMQRFSWQGVAAQHTAVFEKVLSRRAAATAA